MKAYNPADKQLHLLSQLIARTNRTFVAKKEDDSHTNLAFDCVTNRITGRWINAPSGPILLTINLSSLDFEWLDAAYNMVQSFPSVCHTFAEIEQGIYKGLPKLGLDQQGFLEELHYKIPEDYFGSHVLSSPGMEGLSDWKYARKLANQACEYALQIIGTGAEIRIWPHHFDTGTYALAKNRIGIGVGLAMEDQLAGAPYFYVSGYPTNGKPVEYTKFPGLEFGRWETEKDWKGAILVLKDIDMENAFEANSIISAFMKESIGYFMQL